MNEYQRKKVLILVKTYPTPSAQYVETVCTAGVTDDNEWIRLYPIPWRDLENNKRYKIFSWVEINTQKNPKDHRPESFRAHSDSLTISNHLDSKKDIAERVHIVSQLASQSMEEITRKQAENGCSLGAFIPKEVMEITSKKVSAEWSESEKTKLGQMSMLSQADRKPLEKIPYEFRIKFRCDDPTCKGHDMMITEYEFLQSYRSYLARYGTQDEAIRRLKQKYMEMYASEKYQRYLIVGNMHRFQTTFLNIGHYAYIKANLPTHSQPSMFDLMHDM